jgi:hypothetical protein
LPLPAIRRTLGETTPKAATNAANAAAWPQHYVAEIDQVLGFAAVQPKLLNISIA